MKEKTIDIVAMGELLIDFTEAGESNNGQKLFEQNPGGAPANLLTAANRLGADTAFIGKVGKDMHGCFLKKTLEEEGINTDGLIEDENVFTTLAFVEIDKDGERQFSFARKPGADTQIRIDEVDKSILESCRIFHFGSLSLTDEPSRTAVIEAVNIAKKAGAVISYDPNYRPLLWESQEKSVKEMKSVLHMVDILKISDEESILLTGEESPQKALDKLLKEGPEVVAVTLGAEGALVGIMNSEEPFVFMSEALSVKAVDTTGAGDAFWGGFLSKFLEKGKSVGDMTGRDWMDCASYGNVTASFAVRKRGGIPSMPEKAKVDKTFYIINIGE